ncbi:VanZ family protein [Sediminibacterium sp. TEGAF015]|uniref:VanZ family protein n=1 Tax=Sediminibacterium sp. TEGAF015 TaxID=575378 RepID=UPI0022319404|nr:VanZ family protein [Sediminibacterium sp. TEGAF015]
MSNLGKYWKNGPIKPILFFLFFITSFVVFTLPASRVPRIYWINIPHFDKLIHAGIFISLCSSAYLWLVNSFPDFERRIAWTIVLAMGFYGILIEFIQANFIPGRSFEILDILADLAGCMVFWGFRFIIKRL